MTRCFYFTCLLTGLTILIWGTMPSGMQAAGAANPKGDAVILLHGLARSSRSMKPLAEELTRQGYTVFNIDYPSTTHDIASLTEQFLVPVVREARERSGKIHFVTHSMGGVMVRHFLSEHGLSRIGHVVMLAPPNRGSEVVDFLRGFKLYQYAMGPAGMQLSTDADSLPNTLGKTPYRPGVIAGSTSLNPFFSTLLNGPDDGKVSVERTRLVNMADHLVLPCTHTFIMQNKEVIRQVMVFLESGRFDHVTP